MYKTKHNLPQNTEELFMQRGGGYNMRGDIKKDKNKNNKKSVYQHVE